MRMAAIMTKMILFLSLTMSTMNVCAFSPPSPQAAASAAIVASSMTTTRSSCRLSSSRIMTRNRSLQLNLASDSSSEEEDGSSLKEEEDKDALYANLTKQERVLLDAGLITLEDLDKSNPNSKLVASKKATEEKRKSLQKDRKINIGVAVLSFFAAFANYAYQFVHPVTAVELLSEMTSTSAPLESIGRNGKPTLVDFWAPWCDNCRVAAPTLREIEKEYSDRVNFVVINGDGGTELSYQLISKFNVDAIPHLALLDEEGVVQTTLIGPIPVSVLRADIDTLLENAALASGTTVVSNGNVQEEGKDVLVMSPNDSSEGQQPQVEVSQQQQQFMVQSKKELPYKMYDAFRGRPDSDRTIRF
mmetsp:Transcript_10655/g.15911  ORF Transcript_10655/g.15911 Transcript_10655/m.15911 type:complete len:360 (-) Transcript_10655:123-1202(-)